MVTARVDIFVGLLFAGSLFAASAEAQCISDAEAGTEACLAKFKNAADHGEDEAAMLQRPQTKKALERTKKALEKIKQEQLPGHAGPRSKRALRKQQRVYAEIRKFAKFVRNHNSPGLRGTDYNYCKISATYACPIEALPKNNWSIIDPSQDGSPYNVGVNMRCIDSSDFMFKFWRGSSDKLLIYLQGGGACWNEWSTQGLTIPLTSISTGPLCTTSVASQLGFETGPLNMKNSSNPFQNHSVLYVPYCGGDGFGGDTVQNYRIKPNNDSAPFAIQKGYRHVLAAVGWLQGNAGFGQSSKLMDFSLQGCSAGTIGAQVWANSLLGRFAYKNSRVVLDSYAGIFPKAKQGPILTNWGTCDLPILTPSEQADCKNPKGLFITNLTDTSLSNHSLTRFITINSKIDQVQRTFYTFTKYDTEAELIAAFLIHGKAAIEPLEDTVYYKDLNKKILQNYGQYENWQGFLVDGIPHCFNGDSWMVESGFIGGSFYSGPLGYANDTGAPEIPVDVGQVYTNPMPYVCEGESLDPSKAGDSTTYCDSDLAGSPQ